MDVKYSGRIKGCFLTSRETRKPKEGDVGTAQHFSSSFYTQFGTLTLFYMSLTFRVLLSLQFIFFEKKSLQIYSKLYLLPALGVLYSNRTDNQNKSSHETSLQFSGQFD